MSILLVTLAGFLFFTSSGGFPTRREMMALYSLAALLTLASQFQVRFQDCEGVADHSVSYAKAIVWSVVWPMSWIRYLAGRSGLKAAGSNRTPKTDDASGLWALEGAPYPWTWCRLPQGLAQSVCAPTLVERRSTFGSGTYGPMKGLVFIS